MERNYVTVTLCVRQNVSRMVDEFMALSIYRVGKKSCLILSAYVDKTEDIGGTQTTTNSHRENEASSDILREIFYVTIVLCLNIL